jgi:hypothetical protein
MQRNQRGWVAEWLKAPVLKTGCYVFLGPSPSLLSLSVLENQQVVKEGRRKASVVSVAVSVASLMRGISAAAGCLEHPTATWQQT